MGRSCSEGGRRSPPHARVGSASPLEVVRQGQVREVGQERLVVGAGVESGVDERERVAEAVETLDDFTNLMKMYGGAFPDGRVEIYELIAEGDMVAVIGTYKGTHTAPLGPFPATGRVIDSEFAGYHRLENGKIVETWVTWDNLAMFHQLGLDPPAAKAAEQQGTEGQTG